MKNGFQFRQNYTSAALMNDKLESQSCFIAQLEEGLENWFETETETVFLKPQKSKF